MSAAGSFTNESVLLHTDTDHLPNPVYSSIPEAHHQYLVANVRQQEVESPQSTSTFSGVPLPSSSSAALTYDEDLKYDTVNENKSRHTPQSRTAKHGSVISQQPSVGGASNTAITMLADNVLYTGMDEANGLRHKSLAMDRSREYQEKIRIASPDLKIGCVGRNEVVGDTKEKKNSCLLCWAFLMSVMVVLALGAATFTLAILFTGVVDFCRCPSIGSEDRVKALTDRLIVLEDMLAATASSTNVSPGNVDSEPTSTDMGVQSSTETSTVTTEMPTSAMPLLQRMISMDGANLYMNCSTTIEQSCNITTNSFERCSTFLYHIYQRPGEFIMDIGCVRTSSSQEQNAYSFVLDIDESLNFAACFCFVVELAGATSLGGRADLTCGLRVTRCSTEATVISNITITP